MPSGADTLDTVPEHGGQHERTRLSGPEQNWVDGVAQCSGARPVMDADWFVCLHEAHGTQLPALSHQAEWWQ